MLTLFELNGNVILRGNVMFKFKMDIMKLLKENGYTTTRIRKEKLIGQKTLQDLNHGIVPGIKTLETLCHILEMQPGNLIKFVEDTDSSITTNSKNNT